MPSRHPSATPTFFLSFCLVLTFYTLKTSTYGIEFRGEIVRVLWPFCHQSNAPTQSENLQAKELHEFIPVHGLGTAVSPLPAGHVK